MPNSYFQFKQFTIHQNRCAMKVTTDACLFGAWVADEINNEELKINNILCAAVNYFASNFKVKGLSFLPATIMLLNFVASHTCTFGSIFDIDLCQSNTLLLIINC